MGLTQLTLWALWLNSHREDDELDIDAIIEANKDTLPVLPGASRPHS